MKKIIKAYDIPLFIAVVALCLFGLLMVYSSSIITAISRFDYPADFFFRKQMLSLIIGFAAMFFTMIIPYKLYQNEYFLFAMIAGISILLVVLLSIGHTAGNAQSWFKVGTRAVQPAEFAKLAMIIYLAAIYGKRQDRINQIDKAIFPPIVFLAIILFLVAKQPDYGSAAIILFISGTIILSSGMSFKSIAKLLVPSTLGAGAIILAFVLTGNTSVLISDTQMARFNNVFTPFDDAGIGGYQLSNSLIAIGSGGITGAGFGESVQKFGYLPEAHTDFILAIISEELGIFGVMFVFILLGFIVLRGFMLAGKCKDPFGSLLIIGISSMIGIQVFINAGGVSGLIPITGITLPFISYGGSSLLLLLLSMGIVQNVVMRNNRRQQILAEKNAENQNLQA